MSNNILAFDTCLDKMYVALCKNGNIESKIIETTKEHYHSAFLISTIRDVLIENELTPNDINVIATNIGPGSFTGIRACVTVARVFSQGIDNIKTIGVSSLEILSRLNDTDKQTLVALDARKEMAYLAIYEGSKTILAPQTILLEDLNTMIAKNDYYIITDDKLEPILGGFSYQNTDKDLGKFLIQIVQAKLVAGVDTNWRKLHPLYIQPPPITVKK